jgi:hypothetical protein
MMANEVGSTFEDYDARMSRALAFLQKEMVADAIKELNNQRQLVFAYNGFTPKGKAFAVLVKRINEKVYTGISSDELDEVLKDLDAIGLSHADSVEALQDIKKKSKRNLKYIFLKALAKMKRLRKMLYK